MSTLGERIDHLQRLKVQKKELEAQVSTAQQLIDLAEKDLIEYMEGQGVTQASGNLARVSLDNRKLPQVVDWSAFHKYILESGYIHLLENRPSVAGCRELFESHSPIPGVVPFDKKVVRTTKLDE